MLITLNLLVQITPPELWGEAMHVSGLFAHVLKVLIDDTVRDFVAVVTIPTDLDEQAGPVLLTEYIYLLARIIMANPQFFLQLMSATASAQNTAESVLFEGLLDQWWSKVGPVCVYTTNMLLMET
jgi:hypothetical protein